MKQKTITIPIYGQELQIVVCKNFKKIFDKLGIVYGDMDVNSYGAHTVTPPDYKTLAVFFNPNTSNSLIAHETVHIANYIFKHINAKLDLDNDEPYAYLVGYIVDEIEKVLKS